VQTLLEGRESIITKVKIANCILGFSTRKGRNTFVFYVSDRLVYQDYISKYNSEMPSQTHVYISASWVYLHFHNVSELVRAAVAL